jgi:hypothetical protein
MFVFSEIRYPRPNKNAHFSRVLQTGWGYLTKNTRIIRKGASVAGRKSLRKELIELVNERSASDVEIVDRYVQLATTSKQLGADIRKNGTTLTVVNNGNTYLKTNPAIAELTRVSKELNNLKVFFDEKRKAKTSAHEIDESEFL